MQKRKYTIVAQLHRANNKELIEYFERAVGLFSKLQRKAFHMLKYETVSGNKTEYKRFRQSFMQQHGISRRTADSILKDVQGRMKALAELKKLEGKQKETRLAVLQSEIQILDRKITKLQDQLNQGMKIDHVQYWNLKKTRAFKKMRLNKLLLRLKQLQWEMKTGHLKICFGTKKLLKAGSKEFALRRDSRMSYMGSQDETARNQMLQLEYHNRTNQFAIKLRKDFGADEKEKYVYGKCYFNHHKNKLIHILSNANSSPLTYVILRRAGRYYLHCTFEERIKNHSCFVTSKANGTIGADFNKGLIAACETDKNGNLLGTQMYRYRFGQGNKTKSDLEKIILTMVRKCMNTGKNLCIENLDFKNTKAKAVQGKSEKGKKYNQMLHTLAYSMYDQLVSDISFRNRVYVEKVNPAWTSWVAEQKFSSRMKLNIHSGASYVIARRGMGIFDTL